MDKRFTSTGCSVQFYKKFKKKVVIGNRLSGFLDVLSLSFVDQSLRGTNSYSKP